LKPTTSTIYLLKHTPEDVLATHADDQASIDKIISNLPSALESLVPVYTIWISREEDLHRFVSHIPDLAWEMLEYASEPLEILYPQRKYALSIDKDSTAPISIRLVTGKITHAFVRKIGPLITINVDKWPNLAMLADEERSLREQTDTHTRVKTMKLFADGSFTFLR